MSLLSSLRASANETMALAGAVMANPHATQAEFREAFETRDRAYVQSLGMTEEQEAECRFETMCGVNGSDSPYHTYYGLTSDSSRDLEGPDDSLYGWVEGENLDDM